MTRTVCVVLALLGLLVLVGTFDLLGALPWRESLSDTDWLILRELRVPRVLVAVIAGAGLAVCGALMQTFFRNPLAEPGLLGVNAGAMLVVALLVLATPVSAMATGLSALGLVGAGALGAALAFGAIMLVAHRYSDRTVLLILGLLAGHFLSGCVSLLVQFSTPDKIQSFLVWSYGTFGSVGLPQVPWLAAPVAMALAVGMVLANDLDALALGDDSAEALGVSVVRVRRTLVAVVALASGAITAFCGPLGYLGLVTPHLALALLRSTQHRVWLPVTALLGSCLALTADTVAHWPGSDRIFPLNSMASFLGTPVIFWILLRRDRRIL